MIAELERRTRELFEDEPNATPLDFAVDYVASGGTLTDLAAELTEKLGFNVSRHQLSGYLHMTFGDEAALRLAKARREGAHGLAESTLGIAAGADSKDAAQRARVEVNARQWLAGQWNRDEFGQQKQAPIQINLGSLHLDALRIHAQSERESPSPPAPARLISAESDPSAIPGAIPQPDDVVTDAETTG